MMQNLFSGKFMINLHALVQAKEIHWTEIIMQKVVPRI